MSKYYKVEDIFQVIDKIIQNATETDAETIMDTGLVIEINKLPTIEVSEDCSDYYKGYCARYEDCCFHQCKNAPSVTTEQTSMVGEWIVKQSGFAECSVCEQHYFSDYNYCPNCGAKMKGTDNGTVKSKSE